MKKLNLLFIILISVLYISCTKDSTEIEELKTSLTSLIDLNEHGVLATNDSHLNKNNSNIKSIQVSFANGIINTYSSEEINNLIFIRNSNDTREIIMNKSNSNIQLKRNNITVSENEVEFTDMIVGTYLLGKGNIDNVSAPIYQTSCFHTAIAIYSRKSVSEERAQALIDDFLDDWSNSACHQVGGIDTGCTWGDFGCVSAGEIECPSWHSSCN